MLNYIMIGWLYMILTSGYLYTHLSKKDSERGIDISDSIASFIFSVIKIFIWPLLVTIDVLGFVARISTKRGF